jgi:alpha-ketoglutarate-dependent taurine dioxygenase
MQQTQIARLHPSPLAWTAADLPANAGVLRISGLALAEILALAEELRANPLPTLALRPEPFELPNCRALMWRAAGLLNDGPGFVILDRLPLDRLGREISGKIYWLLCCMLARPVAQKWDGTMIYDVTDKGRPPGNGVRPDVTNAQQNFHCDNSYNLCPPDYVALFCLQTAMEGGVNGVVSLRAAHEEMRRLHPDLLARLHQDFLFDRQREHAPDDDKVLAHPIFALHGDRLIGRLSRFQVVNGYKLAGQEMDAPGQAALDAFEAIMNDERLRHDFVFEPGQIQIINNTALGHRRTGFRDWPEPERKRHLIRLWLRDGGRPFYNG